MRIILRTVVIDTPLLTSLSAIHPPKFALKSIVSQGKTQNIPDSWVYIFQVPVGLYISGFESVGV
jgi:hypothetical protein